MKPHWKITSYSAKMKSQHKTTDNEQNYKLSTAQKPKFHGKYF